MKNSYSEPECKVVDMVSRDRLLLGSPADSNTPRYTTDFDNAIDDNDWI